MTMNSVLLKEREGIIQNPDNHFLGPKSGAELALGNGSTPRFTLFPGNIKVSDKGGKSSNLFETFSKQPISAEYHGRLELGYGRSMISGKYVYADPCYGLLSTYGPQISGRVMLPLDLTADEGPIYVNAKQYHGIIRRRISRAKAETLNKALKVRKPYLHQSRHLHAMRRPRGCGGRFLNTKTSNCCKTTTESQKIGSGHFSLSFDSQNSEVLQSDSENLKSPTEANGMKTNLLGTEVTSIFSSTSLDPFSSNHLRSFVHPLSEMMNTGHGFAMTSNWV